MASCRSAYIRPERERGVALVLVLVCLMALSGLVLTSAKLAVDESEDMARLREEYRSDLLAESGLELAKELINFDDDAAVDLPSDPWNFPISKDGISIDISPCNARLDLNQIISVQRVRFALHRLLYGLLLEQRGQAVDKAFSPGSFEYTRAAGQVMRLQDWIDADGDERVDGSEREDYEDGGLWTKPRNGVIVLPEEAALVKFWNTVPLDWIREYTSCYQGAQQVNINFISEAVYRAMFPEFASAWGQVQTYRDSTGFTSVDQLKTAIPDLAADAELSKEILEFVAVQSAFFRVIVEVELPLVYQKRRYILKRGDTDCEVIRCDVLEILQR